MIYLLILFFLILLEIKIDSVQINNEENPHAWKDRARLATCFVVISGASAPDWRYIVLHLIAGGLIFWFFFDYGLNIVRKYIFKHKIGFLHLGDNLLDKFQKRFGGELSWFVWKVILAGVSLYYVIKPEEFFYWF